MTGFETFYNKISDALKGTESGKEMVIRTTYSGIAKTLGLHDFSKSDDYHLVLGILDLAESKDISLGVYLKERICSRAGLSLAEMKMNGKAEQMIKRGATVIEV